MTDSSGMVAFASSWIGVVVHGEAGCFSLVASTFLWFGVMVHREANDLDLDWGIGFVRWL